MPQAVAAAVAFVVKYGAVIYKAFQVAAVAYSAYSAYSAGQQAKRAARAARLEEQERNARRNYRQPVMARRCVYGRERLGGGFLYAHNPDDNTMVAVFMLASHEIAEIEEVYMMDELLNYPAGGGAVTGTYANNIEVHPFLGEPGQDLSGLLNSLGAANITASDKFEGVAGFIIKTENLSKDFPDVDANFNAVFKGKNEIFDCRDGSTGYSTNPALIAYDWLVNHMGEDPDKINKDSIIASANFCDEQVPLKSGGTESRYTINGTILSNQEHREIMEDIAISMAGKIVYSGGQWHIVAGRYMAPVETFTPDDLTDDFEYTFCASERDIPAGVKGTIKSPLHDWQATSYPTVTDGEREDITKIDHNLLDLELPLTNSMSMAQRIAKITLRSAQKEESATLELKPTGLCVMPSDSAYFQLPYYSGDKLFEITGWASAFVPNDEDTGGMKFTTSVSLREYDADIYEWDAEEEQEVDIAEVNLGDVGSYAPSNVDFERTDSAIDTIVDVTWEDGGTSGKTLKQTEIEVCFNTNCQLQTILPGVEIATFTFTPAEPSSVIPVVRVRSCYDDDSFSGWVVV